MTISVSSAVSEQTLEALRAKGFEAPSPIQELTIPKLISGECDLVGQAQTGTGKTAAFGIPIIELGESRAPEAAGACPGPDPRTFDPDRPRN